MISDNASHQPQTSVQRDALVSFDELFSINNKYPGMVGNTIHSSTAVVRCLKCYNTVIVYPDTMTSSVRTTDFKPYGRCKCHNVGCILDSQSTLRVYVEDLGSIHIGSAFLNSSNEVVKYYWGGWSEEHIITPYYEVKNSGITFVPKVKSWDTKPKTKKVHVNSLTESLDLSAGAQGRLFYYKTK